MFHFFSQAAFAVARLQTAGVIVRLTSGDRLGSTCALAKKLGIYAPNAEGMALEGVQRQPFQAPFLILQLRTFLKWRIFSLCSFLGNA
jgi:hypothetical protein